MPVASPENIVIPVGRLPALAFVGIGLFQGRDEPRLQVLSIAVKGSAGVFNAHVLDDLTNRPSEHEPGRDEANSRTPAAINNPIALPPPDSLEWIATPSL